jgi:hypothetical protein
MTDEIPYSLGTPVRVQTYEGMQDGYISTVIPPVSAYGAYVYSVMLFKPFKGIDRVNLVTHQWLVVIKEEG